MYTEEFYLNIIKEKERHKEKSQADPIIIDHQQQSFDFALRCSKKLESTAKFHNLR